MQQLYQQPISDEQMLLAEIIVDALDEDGYLSAPLRELRAANSQQPDLPSATEQQWQQALALVQSLEPMGVAATDLVDCLRLQLLQEAASPQRELALKLIHEDLKLLAGGASATLAARHDSDTDSVAAALQMIRTLEPKPGRPFAASAAPVQADAEIVQQDEQLDVGCCSRPAPASNCTTTPAASAAQRQAAQQLLQALQLREQNLYNIISAAARQQAAMLINHDATLTRPLTQTDLAAHLGLHPSTISRAVRSRYALWRGKLLSLRKLFSHQLIDQHGKPWPQPRSRPRWSRLSPLNYLTSHIRMPRCSNSLPSRASRLPVAPWPSIGSNYRFPPRISGVQAEHCLAPVIGRSSAGCGSLPLGAVFTDKSRPRTT